MSKEFKGELPMVVIFIPEKGEIVTLSEGCGGTNISKEDREKGIKDYINYSKYDIHNLDAGEIDGGQQDYTEFIQDKFDSLEEAIPDMLNFIYDRNDFGYIQLYPRFKVNVVDAFTEVTEHKEE
jgi:hypothetical protein